MFQIICTKLQFLSKRLYKTNSSNVLFRENSKDVLTDSQSKHFSTQTELYDKILPRIHHSSNRYSISAACGAIITGLVVHKSNTYRHGSYISTLRQHDTTHSAQKKNS